jgi:prepilin-type N-terminal cleavage/methylation domain-containing protein
MAMRAQSGFTILELMVVVAIIAVLAAIAIPAFSSDSRKASAESEVNPMFAELASREEQYGLERGGYLAAPACPAAPSTSPQDASGCIANGQPWSTLKVRLPDFKVRCSYAITAGAPGTVPSPPSPFTMPTSGGAWFYIVATCDMDSSTTANSRFFISNLDAIIQTSKEGS